MTHFRILTVACFTLLVAAFLAACGSSSSSTGGPGNGALKVEHRVDSPGIVDRFVVSEQFGARSFEVDVNLAPGESHTVTELLPGFYDVEVEWADGGMRTYMDVLVEGGQTTELVVGR